MDRDELNSEKVIDRIEICQFQQAFSQKSNKTILALSVAIAAFYVLEEMWGGSSYMPTLMRMGANSTQLVFRGEWWRLISSIFLHGGFLHVFFNIYVLFALGSFINRLFGGPTFLLLFFVSGLCGSLASVMIGHSAVSVGASGALWGLFGASTALILKPSQYLPEAIRLRLRRVTLINLAINLAISFLPMVDLWAHLGGGLCGFLVGLLMMDARAQKSWHYLEQRQKQPWKSQFVSFAASPVTLPVVLLMVGAVCVALWHGQPWRLVQPIRFESQIVGDTKILVGIPDIIALTDMQTRNSLTSYAYGLFPRDPMMVMVTVLPSPRPSGNEAVQELYEFRRRLLSGASRQVLPPRADTIDGHPTLIEAVKIQEGVVVYRYFQRQEDYLLALEVAVLPDSPASVIQGAKSVIDHVFSVEESV